MNVFDFINSVTFNKTLIKFDTTTEKEYVPFVVNRSLSYFPDTILAANEMNIFNGLDKELQYHYLLNIVRPAKRFAKWVKRVDSKDFEAVQQFYKLNDAKTLDALRILSDENKKTIHRALDPGG